MAEDMMVTDSHKRFANSMAPACGRPRNSLPSQNERYSHIGIDSVELEVRAILWSAQLSLVRRFNWQPYWEEESAASDKALEIEGGLPLENVAEHSWKVADMAMLLYHLVPGVNRAYCLELALLHDKLELITGDYSPIDEDATGQSTHAFNENSAMAKKTDEHNALKVYLRLLPEPIRDYQRLIIEDAIEVKSAEAKFVNALDKLAALAYVVVKKSRGLREEHLDFTTKYSGKAILECPALLPHHALLVSMLKQVESASA
jgi:5'-deoxynucleotidase YfbR-like HD superfamily hydrolase